MSTARLLRSSLKMMGRYKLRTGFMMLGSVIGVAALTFVLTIGAAAEKKLLATVRQLFGPSSIIVNGGGGLFIGGPHGPPRPLTPHDPAPLAPAPPPLPTPPP